MESILGNAILILGLIAHLFVAGVSGYALYRTVPIWNREVQRQEDACVQELADGSRINPLLESSNLRFPALAIGSIAVWPFALIGWTLAGWVGIGLAAALGILTALAMNNSLVTLREKVRRARAAKVATGGTGS